MLTITPSASGPISSVQRVAGAAEARLASIRNQTAIVRALADEIDAFGVNGDASLRTQLAEELARLGCRILEAASAMAEENDRIA
jgi:hypothetical protein